MTGTTITFGTRGSALARQQTNNAARLLKAAFPALHIETVTFSTQGDRELNKPLPQIGGKGLFTAELEAALDSGEIDLAVHSLKDLPTDDAAGLTIGAILARENPADVLVSRSSYTMASLPPEATVGTSSLRRTAQLKAARPDLHIEPIRGNVDTRLKKALDPDGPYDAIVLAAAGLKRMALAEHISDTFAFEVMLPAPGQGAVAVQCRANDLRTLERLAALDDLVTRQAVLAERAFLAELGGGCSLPVGAYATVNGPDIHLRAVVVGLDGAPVIRLETTGPAAEAARLGRFLAQEALGKGAQSILEAIHAEQPAR